MSVYKKAVADKGWIADEETGSYYKLFFGRVLQCPMNLDGSRDDNSGEVEDSKEAVKIFNRLMGKLDL